MKALVIENSPIFRKVVAHALGLLDIDVVLAESAAQGVQQLQAHRVDLLIMDLHLPDESGLDLCRRIRAQSAHRMLPLLLLTSDESPELTQRALDAGITEVFRKSRLDAFNASLQEYIQRLQREYRGRVLLVEDSPTTSVLLKYLLTRMNLAVDHVDTAEAGIVAVRERGYDLVISDVVLAGELSGLGLVRAVRAMPGDAGRTPILGLSALQDAARRIEMLRRGANDFVAKPVLEEEFMARVGNLVAAKQLLDQVQLQRRELQALSMRDTLTGLYNRHYLAESGPQCVGLAQRSQQALSVLVVEVDHFQRLVEDYGHDVGDTVLASLGRLIAGGSRRGDVAARFGNEQFVLLLPACQRGSALLRAQRLLDDMRLQRPADLSITASIGVAALASDGPADFEELLQQARQALHRNRPRSRSSVTGPALLAA